MIIKDYTPQQLKAFLRPAQVQTEFGIEKSTLENMRTCSIDDGKLRGPMFLKDNLIILYQRQSVIYWLKKTMFHEAETDETGKTAKGNKSIAK